MTPEERIHEAADKYAYDHKSRASHIAGAYDEHSKAWNEAIEVCQKEFAKWLTTPLELGSVFMEKLESLKK